MISMEARELRLGNYIQDEKGVLFMVSGKSRANDARGNCCAHNRNVFVYTNVKQKN